MLGPFTFTLKKLKKWVAAAADLYQTLINTIASDGANKQILQIKMSPVKKLGQLHEIPLAVIPGLILN